MNRVKRNFHKSFLIYIFVLYYFNNLAAAGNCVSVTDDQLRLTAQQAFHNDGGVLFYPPTILLGEVATKIHFGPKFQVYTINENSLLNYDGSDSLNSTLIPQNDWFVFALTDAENEIIGSFRFRCDDTNLPVFDIYNGWPVKEIKSILDRVDLTNATIKYVTFNHQRNFLLIEKSGRSIYYPLHYHYDLNRNAKPDETGGFDAKAIFLLIAGDLIKRVNVANYSSDSGLFIPKLLNQNEQGINTFITRQAKMKLLPSTDGRILFELNEYKLNQ